MPVLVVGTEKNFAALRPRLFTGRISTKAAGEVAAAIRAANPDVNLDKLKPGTVLTIPDTPNVRVRGELSLDETTRSALEGLSNVGKAALEELAGAAGAREAEAAAERKAVAKALDAAGADPATRRDKALLADLTAAGKAVAEEDVRAKERAATLKKAQAEWTAGLDAMKELLG